MFGQIVLNFGDIQPAQFLRNSSKLLNATFLADACNVDVITKNLEKGFIKSWIESVKSSSKLEYYASVKSDFVWENYLDHSYNFNARRSTAQIRCSSHKLRIETGRHQKIDRQERICLYCQEHDSRSMIDDENHLLHSCSIGDEERQTFIKRIMDIAGPSQDHKMDLMDAIQDQSLKKPSDRDIELIKLSTRAIHIIYQYKLKYRKSLKVKGQVNT